MANRIRIPELLFAAVLISLGPQVASAGDYFVDCTARDAGSGSRSAPWGSLAAVNRWRAFAPGDHLRLRAGTRCAGPLAPQGQGARGRPIVLTSYGKGARPIIAAGKAPAALTLTDQSWWTLSGLHLVGGARWGVHITAVSGLVRGITLRNLVVERVTGGALDSKDTGLVVIAPEPRDARNSAGARFDQVLVDGVLARSTTMWAGILVGTGSPRSNWFLDEAKRSTRVTVRNSVVHHVYGDGIILFVVNDGLLDHNVAHHSGIQPTKTIGTPNAIWTWACDRCVVQYNEAYENASPGIDGGAFDIDFHSKDSVVQYNYGHDNAAYCVAVFAAEEKVTINSTIRYNICSNNGTKAVKQRTEIEISAIEGSSIDGLQIYGNSFYTRNKLIHVSDGALKGARPRTFQNNIVYSTSDLEQDGLEDFESGHNVWYLPRGKVSHREAGSLYADPLFVGEARGAMRSAGDFRLRDRSPAIGAGAGIPDSGGRDHFGGRVPRCGRLDIGAVESARRRAIRARESPGATTDVLH